MKVSRLISSLVIVCLLAAAVFAQNGKMYGIKGGYTLSNFWGDGTDNLTNSLEAVTTNLDERNFPWFTVSLFSSRELIPDFAAVQSELVYIRGGKAFKGTFGGAERHFSLEVDYIQMPFMLKILFPFPVKPSIYAGPYISWMFRSRVNNLPSTASTTSFFEGNDVAGEVYNQNTNVIDIGFVSGLDFAIPFGPGSIVLDGRFQLGALDVYNYANARKVRNYIFSIMGGYALDFGGAL